MFKWKRKSFFNYDLETKDQIEKKQQKEIIDNSPTLLKPAEDDDDDMEDFNIDDDDDFNFLQEENGFSSMELPPLDDDDDNLSSSFYAPRETAKSDKIFKLLTFKNKSRPATKDSKSNQTIPSKSKPPQPLRQNNFPTNNFSTNNFPLHSIFSNDSVASVPPLREVKIPSVKIKKDPATKGPPRNRGAGAATVNKKYVNEDGHFVCTMCPYISKYITHFEMHMKHSHPGTPIFLCDVCGFETKAKNYLSVHMMNHLGLKPYKCTECDYASPRKEYLDLHLKKHFKVYCLYCMFCPYSTYRQDYLARHVSDKH